MISSGEKKKGAHGSAWKVGAIEAALVTDRDAHLGRGIVQPRIPTALLACTT